ncbi:hypothetical protein [Xanthobacter autotrophicus]|uniref:hypothetical protein n=1 Tax=Xanthobacter autotrophicus TaxID=280 RepID=UPI003729C038
MASDDPKAEGFASRPSRTPPTLDLKAEEVATTGAPGPAAAQHAGAKETGTKDTGAKDTGMATIAAQGAGSPEPGKDLKAAAADSRPGEAKPAPSMPVEPKSADPKSADIRPAGTAPTGPKLSDAKPADSRPADSKPSDSKPSDSNPVGAKPAEAAASASGEPAAAASTGAAKASAPVAAAPAPARSGKGGAVFAGLIAGLIGGGAVAGGLWYALPQFFPPPAPVVEPAPVVNLTPLQTRIAALEARPAFDPRAIAALSERLERSEATLKSLDATVAALKSAPAPAPVATAPAQAPAPAPAVPPALLKTVDDLKASSEATREALAAARRDIEALRAVESNLHTAVAAATAGAQQAGAQAQAQVQALAQSLTPKVEAVGPRLDALKAQIEAATAAATAFNRAAAGLVVLATFRDAVVSGRPFAAELAAARTTLGPAAGQLDPFAPAAAEGYAAPGKLATMLAQQGAAALAAERPAAPAPADSSGSLLDRLLASAEGLVKVRPVSGPGSVDSEGVIATAVGQVKAGQLDDALATLKKLPDTLQARLAVIREIEARTAAVRVAGTLYQQQLAAISRKVP